MSEHRDRWGVAPICAVLAEHGLRIAPSTYYEAVERRPSARALRDEQLQRHIQRVFDGSGGTFGPRRVWRALNEDGIVVARCTVERLMAGVGLHGGRLSSRPGDDRRPAPRPAAAAGDR